MRLPVKQQL